MDTDNDGVRDTLDQCAATPANEGVANNGCSVSQGDATAGAQVWAAQCVLCHGNFANAAGAAYPISADDLSRTTAANLARYIETNMPQPTASNCVGKCAADVAAFFADLNEQPVVADPVAGEALYKTTCASCHGASGQGTPPVFPSVQGATAADLTAIIASGTTMRAIGSSLTPAQIQNLGAYMSTLPSAPVGNAVNGQALYTSKICSACHGANRQGGAGPALTAAALAPKYANPEALVTKIKSMSAYMAAAATNDAEALDIAAFLLQ